MTRLTRLLILMAFLPAAVLPVAGLEVCLCSIVATDCESCCEEVEVVEVVEAAEESGCGCCCEQEPAEGSDEDRALDGMPRRCEGCLVLSVDNERDEVAAEFSKSVEIELPSRPCLATVEILPRASQDRPGGAPLHSPPPRAPLPLLI